MQYNLFTIFPLSGPFAITAINNQKACTGKYWLELISFKKYIYEIGSWGNQLILYNGI
jgi:hypothetical protein